MFIRHRHKLFNTLIQNAATVVFKRWMVRCYTNLEKQNVAQVLAYHDELGFEAYVSKESQAIGWGESLADQARVTGELMKLNVPISAEARVGKRYNEVH